MRVSLLLGKTGTVRPALEPTLRKLGPKVRLSVVECGGRVQGQAFLKLIARRPHLIVADATAAEAAPAALYRALRPQSRLLLCTAETSGRAASWSERFVRKRVDGMLAEGDDVGRAIERLRMAAPKLASWATPPDLDLFFAGRATKEENAVRRLLHVGPLSADSGAVEVLIAVAAWADQHHDQAAEIWWAGDGDLAGILEPQPLPANMSQRFLGALDRRDLADALGACDFLVAVSARGEHAPPLFEALAAGSLVVASRRIPLARHLLQAGVPGWLFDPIPPIGLSQVLDAALGATAATLDSMRAEAQQLVRTNWAAPSPEEPREAVVPLLDEGHLTGSAALT